MLGKIPRAILLGPAVGVIRRVHGEDADTFRSAWKSIVGNFGAGGYNQWILLGVTEEIQRFIDTACRKLMHRSTHMF